MLSVRRNCSFYVAMIPPTVFFFLLLLFVSKGIFEISSLDTSLLKMHVNTIGIFKHDTKQFFLSLSTALSSLAFLPVNDTLKNDMRRRKKSRACPVDLYVEKLGTLHCITSILFCKNRMTAADF